MGRRGRGPSGRGHRAAGWGLGGAGRCGRTRLRPEVCPLEERRLLSTFNVNSTGDTLDSLGNPATGTLRWAVQQANAAVDASSIAFDPTVFASPRTITLLNGQLELTKTGTPVTISGPAGGVTVSGGNASRVFQLDNGVVATISGLTITKGKVSGTGGGINVVRGGTLTLQDSVIGSCYASGHGGGLYSDGTATLTGCTISGNNSNDWGGGIESFYDATMTVANCVISGNFSQAGGGAINNNNNITVTNSTLSGNKSGWRLGGGIATNHGAVEMTGCTISGNLGSGGGGGVAIFDGSCTLTECTISGNTTSSVGGGVDLMSGTCKLVDCTVSGNTAQGSGGGVSNQGKLTLIGTIVAGDTSGAGNEIDGVGASGSNNLIGPGGGGLVDGQGGNIVGVADPLLAPLGDYGGPTWTMALLPGSPALGAGTTVSGITADQRGKPLDSPSPDIGAFQSHGFTLGTVVGGSSQVAPIGSAFANPLTVTVTANDPTEPVAGGVVTFAVPAAGASASIPAATVGAGGVASAVATANTIAGSYIVTATVAGVSGSALFNLTNVLPLGFQSLADQAITFGTAGVTMTGKLSDGSQSPQGETVTVTLNGVQHLATINANGTFATTFATSTLSPNGSPYKVTYAYAGDGTFGPASATSSLTVNRATPSITWPTPADITYGGALGSAQLDATANVPGTFYYSPAAGTVLKAGAGQALSVTFVPTDSVDYNATTAATTINVLKVTPTVTWPSPADITYGTVLGASQLDATSSVPGKFAYTPAAGTLLKAGMGQTLSVTFTPTDSVDYAAVTTTVPINVLKASTSVAWTTPADITYGVALGVNQLNAVGSVPGTLTYTPAAGTVLKAGAGQMLSVSFTPVDSVDYLPATSTVTINVRKITPTVTWPTPADITYGMALGVNQLNAGASVPGTFVYTPAAGAVLQAGSGQALSVTFIPTDSVDYGTMTATTAINVVKAMPAVTWPAPAAIPYGTALGGSQLDAAASVPGTFAYTPAAGTVLKAGMGQVLRVVFTPTDSVDYAPLTFATTVDVVKVSPSLGVSAAGGTYDGGAFAASYTLGGTGGAPAISLEGVTPTLAYYAGPTTAGASLGSSPPTHAGTYTVVARFAGSADFSAAQSAPTTFTIDRAAAAVSLAATAASVVYGQAVTLVATIAAGASPGGAVTFFDGSTPLGTSPVDASGEATLTVASLPTGSHAVAARFDGGTDFAVAQSSSAPLTVRADASGIAVTFHGVYKKRKQLQSVGMTAAINPAAPGGGVPTGQVTFELITKKRKKTTVKVLGTAPLTAGQATLTIKPQKVMKKVITVVYGGDPNFLATTVTLPKLAKSSVQ